MTTYQTPEGYYVTEDDGEDVTGGLSAGVLLTQDALNLSPALDSVPQGQENLTKNGELDNYEDDNIVYSYFTYFDNGDMKSYIEKNKATGEMIQHIFTPTGKVIGADPVDEYDVDGNMTLRDDSPDGFREYTETTVKIRTILRGRPIPE